MPFRAVTCCVELFYLYSVCTQCIFNALCTHVFVSDCVDTYVCCTPVYVINFVYLPLNIQRCQFHWSCITFPICSLVCTVGQQYRNCSGNLVAQELTQRRLHTSVKHTIDADVAQRHNMNFGMVCIRICVKVYVVCVVIQRVMKRPLITMV